MRGSIFAFLGILLCVLLEAVFFAVPLTLFLLIIVSVFSKKSWVFFLAIFAGFLLDSLLFQTLGFRSLFFLCVTGLIFLYGRKFEIENNFFIGIITLIASLVYFLFFGFSNLLLQMVFAMLLPIFSLVGIMLVKKIKVKMV